MRKEMMEILHAQVAKGLIVVQQVVKEMAIAKEHLIALVVVLIETQVVDQNAMVTEVSIVEIVVSIEIQIQILIVLKKEHQADLIEPKKAQIVKVDLIALAV